jgi:hypothetical protein
MAPQINVLLRKLNVDALAWMVPHLHCTCQVDLRGTCVEQLLAALPESMAAMVEHEQLHSFAMEMVPKLCRAMAGHCFSCKPEEY